MPLAEEHAAAAPGPPAAAGAPAAAAADACAPSAAALAGAARAAALRHVQTLSDDEEWGTFGAVGATESEPDTEELLGRVDWSLAANSDDEAPPG